LSHTTCPLLFAHYLPLPCRTLLASFSACAVLQGVTRVLPVYISLDKGKEGEAACHGGGSFIPFPSVDCMGGSLHDTFSKTSQHGDKDAQCLFMRSLAGVSLQLILYTLLADSNHHTLFKTYTGRATLARIILRFAELEPLFTGGTEGALEVLACLEAMRTEPLEVRLHRLEPPPPRCCPILPHDMCMCGVHRLSRY
jgi:hypothetical protein